MNKLFLESNSIKSAGAPKDLNGSALAGSRIKLDKGYGCAIVMHFGAGAGATVSVDLDQHDAATAGNSKALNISRNYYVKSGADTSFTKTEIRPDDAGLSDSADLSATVGADSGIAVFDVKPEDLDADNSFAYISANLADSTAAKIASVEYHIYDIKVGLGYEQDL